MQNLFEAITENKKRRDSFHMAHRAPVILVTLDHTILKTLVLLNVFLPSEFNVAAAIFIYC